MKKRNLAVRSMLPVICCLACARGDTVGNQSFKHLDLLRAIPADAVAVYTCFPEDSGDAAASSNMLNHTGVLANLALETGLLANLDPAVRLWIDLIASFGLVLEYPHSVTLLAIEAKSREGGGHRLARLQAAIVIDTAGKHEKLEQKLQSLLSAHTSSDHTTLTESLDGDIKRFSMVDRRLPNWCVVQWASLGRQYVVTIGEGSLDRVLESHRQTQPSLARNEWLSKAMNRQESLLSPSTVFVNFDPVAKIDDAVLAEKVASVRQALRLADVHRALLTIRQDGRSVEAEVCARRGEEDVRMQIAGAQLLEHISRHVVPADATGFAVFDLRLDALVEVIGTAYLAARSQQGRTQTIEFWNAIQERADVSISRDILGQLDPFVVVHNDPPHPLGLPLLWTYVVSINGSAEDVRRSLDRLLEYVQSELADSGLLQLRRDADGVWFLRMGIQGPAMVVHDRWLILSHTPYAVRACIKRLEQLKSR